MPSVLTFNGHGLKLMTSSGYVRVSGEKYDPVYNVNVLQSENGSVSASPLSGTYGN